MNSHDKSLELGNFYLWELLVVLIPSLLFGIFMQGMSPEDPNLRQSYFLIFFAVIPIVILGGAILNFIFMKTRVNQNIFKIIIMVVDCAIILISMALVLWFQWKISFGFGDFTNNYPGWHWQSYYQQRLIAILVGLLSFQFIMNQPNQPNQPNISDLNQKNKRSELWIGLLFIQMGFTALFGQWFHLFFGLACIGMILFIYRLLVLLIPQDGKNFNESVELNASTAFKPKFIFFYIGKPVMSLLIGFGMGFIVVSTHWTAKWLSYFTMVIGLYLLISIGIGKLHLLSNQKNRIMLILVGLIFVTGQILYLQENSLASNVFLWSILLTGFLSFMMAGFKGNNITLKFNFLRPIQFIFGILFYAVGVAGGISFLYYTPLGNEIGMILLSGGLIFLWIILIFEYMYLKYHKREVEKHR